VITTGVFLGSVLLCNKKLVSFFSPPKKEQNWLNFALKKIISHFFGLEKTTN
jgi:hypothetical protein